MRETPTLWRGRLTNEWQRRHYASLIHQGARGAFLDTMRSVIGPEGQKVSALDRLYLADQIPFLLIWGNEDPVIPVEHGCSAMREGARHSGKKANP